jgi:hypothetical protein
MTFEIKHSPTKPTNIINSDVKKTNNTTSTAVDAYRLRGEADETLSMRGRQKKPGTRFKHWCPGSQTRSTHSSKSMLHQQNISTKNHAQ